ncbi:hypothetical protein IGL98_000940 [Enterococcus sp. DIV0840]|uniref:helix-turn-helix domain-containing protein n=1 Tax=unclassified Enterococcus TaxID=2608891 RepID=UPI003255373A
MNTFDRVKKLADKQKITIVELEERLKFGKNSLYAWKKKVPNGSNLSKVADYFNVSTDYLLGRTNIDIPVNELVFSKAQSSYLENIAQDSEIISINEDYEPLYEINDLEKMKAQLADPQYLNKQKERYEDIRKLLASFNVPDTPESREALLFFMFELKENFSLH